MKLKTLAMVAALCLGSLMGVSTLTADTMMYVFGNFLFICPVMSFCCPVFVLLRFSELQI